jgi:hypothetical protein
LYLLKLPKPSFSKGGGEIMSNKINNLFPPGSRLRAVINLAIGGMYVLRNEGIASFLTKVWLIMKTGSSTPEAVHQEEIYPRAVLQKKTHPLQFPSYENPKVSIVIPFFNKPRHLHNTITYNLKVCSMPRAYFGAINGALVWLLSNS